MGLAWQETVGTELGRRQPHLPHLRQHPVRRKLVAPARNLADAPGDRSAGDPVVARLLGGHRRLHCCTQPRGPASPPRPGPATGAPPVGPPSRADPASRRSVGRTAPQRLRTVVETPPPRGRRPCRIDRCPAWKHPEGDAARDPGTRTNGGVRWSGRAEPEVGARCRAERTAQVSAIDGAGGGAPRTLGVAVAGMGWMGRVHTQAYIRVAHHFPGLPVRPELVAVADEAPGRAQEAAELFGFATATRDWREGGADPRGEAGGVTPPHLPPPRDRGRGGA